MQTAILTGIKEGRQSTLEDFLIYVKTAVVQVQESSPNLGVEKWRYCAIKSLSGLTASSLRRLRKDLQIRVGLRYIRLSQDNLENALRGWLKLLKAYGLNNLSQLVCVRRKKVGQSAAGELAQKWLTQLNQGAHSSGVGARQLSQMACVKRKKVGQSAAGDLAKEWLTKLKKGALPSGIRAQSGGWDAKKSFLYFTIQSRRHKCIEDAEVSLNGMEKVISLVRTSLFTEIMAGRQSTLESFVIYVKAAVAQVRESSPDLGVEKWRYCAIKSLSGLTASGLRRLRKDPQMSVGVTYICVRQDIMENALRGWFKLLKSYGLNKLSQIANVEEMEGRQSAADELAREGLSKLKKGQHPSDEVVNKALRLWGFERRIFGENVIPEGQEWEHSDTLRIIESRFNGSRIIISPCTGYENFVRLLGFWAHKRTSNGQLPFTTMLFKNYAGKLHRVTGNTGTSVGLAIGSFTGSKLRYWAGDSQEGARSAHVEAVRDDPGNALNTRRGVVFDGDCAHEVEPFRGKRYSLMFFTVEKYKKASNAVKRKMVNMTVDSNTDDILERLQAKVLRAVARKSAKGSCGEGT